MSNMPPDLAALIGSRICHDLISPIGAINNGLELLGMSGDVSGPELSLISESVENASARIRFFRLAFGAAGDQEVSAREIRGVLADMSKSSKLSIHWSSDNAVQRGKVRVLFLAEQCLETAMPYGGNITVVQNENGWVLRGSCDKFRIDQQLWSMLAEGKLPSDIAPAHVHFALLASHCRDEGHRLHTELGNDEIVIRI